MGLTPHGLAGRLILPTSLLFVCPSLGSTLNCNFEVATTAGTPPNSLLGLHTRQGHLCCAHGPNQQPPRETATGESYTCKLAIPHSTGILRCHATCLCIHGSQALAICGAGPPGTYNKPSGLSCCCDISACWDLVLPPHLGPSPKAATFHADFLSMWNGVSACRSF